MIIHYQKINLIQEIFIFKSLFLFTEPRHSGQDVIQGQFFYRVQLV